MRCVVCLDSVVGCFACKPREVKFKKGVRFVAPKPVDLQTALKAEPKLMQSWSQLEAPKPAKWNDRCIAGEPGCNCIDRMRERPAMWGVPRSVAAPPPPRPQLPDRITPALAKAGFERGRFLGRGAFARVYESNRPGFVIKVTGDESDACVAELARRKQQNGDCRNLMRIYNVWRFRQHPTWADSESWRMEGDDKYVIIAERLRPLTDAEKAKLPGHDAFIDDRACDPLMSARLARAGQNKPSKWDSQFNWTHAAALNLAGICGDLEAIGVTEWTDFHLNNVMMRPSEKRVVISDFGCSRSPVPEFEEA